MPAPPPLRVTVLIVVAPASVWVPAAAPVAPPLAPELVPELLRVVPLVLRAAAHGQTLGRDKRRAVIGRVVVAHVE